MLKTYATHFCGVGGACYGIEQAGLECKLAIDHWAPAIETREKNLKHKGMCIPIEDYVPDQAHAADLLWTSPPCQTFSSCSREVNRMNKDDKRNILFLNSVDYVKNFKPKYFVLENVMGMYSHDADGQGNGTVKEMEKVFKDYGYHTECGTLNSQYWGLPQARERVFIVGSLEGKKGLLPLEGTEITKRFGDIMEKGTVEGCWTQSYKTALDKVSRTGISIDVITENDVLPTITCGWGGGATRKKVAILDKKGKITYLRHPTVKEGARAQGFPDNWEFPKSEANAWKMIGNAVSSPVSKAIIEHLKKVEAGDHPPSNKNLSINNSHYNPRIPKYVKEMYGDVPPEMQLED